MFANMNGWHLVIVLAIVLLLFGAPRLPALARSMGQSLRIFRGETKELSTSVEAAAAPAAGEASAAASAGHPAEPPAARSE